MDLALAYISISFFQMILCVLRCFIAFKVRYGQTTACKFHVAQDVIRKSRRQWQFAEYGLPTSREIRVREEA